MRIITLTHEHLLELVSYNSGTGEFHWLERPLKFFDATRGAVSRTPEHNCSNWNARYSGRPAGYKTEKGYLMIHIFKVKYFAHRLAWFYVNGSLPNGEMDHRDGDRLNNRIDNLRLATRSQNLANKKTISKSGFRGVYRDTRRKGKPWVARIRINGSYRWLGNYSDKNKASEAYARAAQEYYGEYSYLARVRT